MPVFRNILLVFAILLLAFFSWLSYYRIKVLINSSNSVNHANLVILKIEQTLSIVRDAETGQRAFLVTDDSVFLKPTINSKEGVNNVFTEIRSLVSDNNIQLQNLDKLKNAVNTRLDHLKITRDYKMTKNFDTAILRSYLLEGTRNMDSVRSIAVTMEQTEQLLLNEREKMHEKNVVLAPSFSLIITGILLMVVIISFYVVMRKYDQQKQIQGKLAASEQKFKDILESAPDAMIIINEDGVIKIANGQAENILGYLREELIGKQISFLIPDRFLGRHPLYRKSYFKNPKSRGMGDGRELFAKTGDGSEIPVEISLSPLHTDEGLFVCAAIRDVTEKKKNQQALIESEKLSVVSAMSRTLAHEIRNPLTNINLSVSLARERFKDMNDFRELDDHLNIISRNYERINKIVTDILYAHRYEKKALKPVNLEEIVEQALINASDRLLIRGITVEKNYHKNYLIMADRKDLEIALLNIIVNAIEAMSRNTGLLQISINKNAEIIELAIKDNGGGMTAEEIAKMFDPYYSKKTTGLGVGLASVKSILQNHHAETQITSEPGKGTVFTIFFQSLI